MVIDTSALVAILRMEPEATQIADLIAASSKRIISAVTRVEVSCVTETRTGNQGRQTLERLLEESQIETSIVTLRQVEIALGAFHAYGKGRHKARLNIGDCFAYALAKALDMPLLFKGDDFAKTDVRPALTTSTR